MTDERFRMQMVFPVAGDSAIVELTHDGEQWAEIRLEDLRIDAVGEDRLREAPGRPHPASADRAPRMGVRPRGRGRPARGRARLAARERGGREPARQGRPHLKIERWQPDAET